MPKRPDWWTCVLLYCIVSSLLLVLRTHLEPGVRICRNPIPCLLVCPTLFLQRSKWYVFVPCAVKRSLSCQYSRENLLSVLLSPIIIHQRQSNLPLILPSNRPMCISKSPSKRLHCPLSTYYQGHETEQANVLIPERATFIREFCSSTSFCFNNFKM